jgi:hypothetical protein
MLSQRLVNKVQSDGCVANRNRMTRDVVIFSRVARRPGWSRCAGCGISEPT